MRLEARSGLRYFAFFLDVQVNNVIIALIMVIVYGTYLIVTIFENATWIKILGAFVNRVYSLRLGSPHFEPFFNTFFDNFYAVFFAKLLSLLTRQLLLFLIPEGIKLTLFAHLLRILHVLKVLRL